MDYTYTKGDNMTKDKAVERHCYDCRFEANKFDDAIPPCSECVNLDKHMTSEEFAEYVKRRNNG